MHIALVTGGTRGIGAAISEALKEKGHTVIATYQANDAKAQAFQEKTGIEVMKWNAAVYEDCINGIEHIKKKHGPVDILVNNAGITRDTMLHKMTQEQWDDVVTTNLTSCFHMCRIVIQDMRERGFGRIINITSVNGQKGQIGQCNYAAAKAGMIGFTRSLAQESASKGITVNAIAPGYINTEMVQSVAPEVLQKILAQIPVGRLGEASEVARAVAFLSDDQAGFITGAVFSINGGQHFA